MLPSQGRDRGFESPRPLHENIINLDFLNEETDTEDNTQQSKLVLEDITSIFKNSKEATHRLVVDLTHVGKVNYASDKSKELFSKYPYFKELTKIAVVSTSLIVKTMVISISLATGKYESVKSFERKDEALKWLSSS